MSKYLMILLFHLASIPGCFPHSKAPLSDDSDSSPSTELIGDWYAIYENNWTEVTLRSKSSSNATMQFVIDKHTQDFNVSRDGDLFYLSLPFPDLDFRSKQKNVFYLFLLKPCDDCYGVYPIRSDPCLDAIDHNLLSGTFTKNPKGELDICLNGPKTQLIQYIRENQATLFYETPIILLTKSKPTFQQKPRPKEVRRPGLIETLLNLSISL